MKLTSSLIISVSGTQLILDPERAIYWPDQETLFVTDLHLGKVGHFHQAGIAIPGQVVTDDYERLHLLMQRYRVKHWICLGDLFHSHWNKEHVLFLQWRATYPDLNLTLIEGNHDRYMRRHYGKLEIAIHPHLDLQPFYLTHDWKGQQIPHARYALSGHLHPCIRLYGQGKQKVKLPCFWFQTQGAYLPAFGQFTGAHAVEPQENDKIYVITPSKFIEIST